MGGLSKFFSGIMLFFVLLLSACGGDDTEENNDSGTSEETSVYSYEDFEQSVSNTAEPTGEGVLNIGYAMDTPFEGTFNWAFYTLGPDQDILEYFDEPVFTFDENHQTTNEGAIHYEMNEEERSVTFTVQDGVNWHDGEPLKITDYIASYMVIGHPDYEGVAGMTDGFTLIEGYDEYQAGESDEISGIEVLDEQTAVFTYKEIAPSLTTGGFWPYAFPEHHYEGVEVSEMTEAPETRENPIGIGPYKVDSIVSGESLTLVKNEDYWRGEPKLDGINLTVISPSSITNALESGEIDMTINFPTHQYPDVSDMEGVEWLAQVEPIYDYIGFKLGEWNAEEGKVDYKPDEMKMGDINLRRAMWHAIDNNTVGEQFYNGMRWEAVSLILPYHKDFHNDNIDIPEYDTAEAERILDEAGYEDVNGDGFRETPEGDELVINFASLEGGDIQEPLTNYYIQEWRGVGLNVVKTNDRLIEYNTFYDMLGNDDPEIDVFLAGWTVQEDVDPSENFGASAPYNYYRYETEENTELLRRGNSTESLDLDTRIDVYNEWQQLMTDDIPVIPTLYRSSVYPVSEKVVNYSVNISFDEDYALYNLGLSE